MEPPAIVASDVDVETDEDTPVMGQLLATGGTFVLDDAPAHGTVTVSGSGAFHYQPAADFFGDDQFTFHADDSNVATARIGVRPVNDPPVITSNGAIEATVGTPFELLLSFVSITDVDTTTGFSIVASSGEHYEVSGATIQPEVGYVGSLSVPVQVSDGSALSNTVTLAVEVKSAPAVIAGQATFPSMAEEGTLTITAADLDFFDPDSTAHTVVVDPGTSYTVEPDGATLRGALDFFGTLSVNLRLFDGSSYSAPFVFFVTVTNVNDAPVLAAPAARTTAIGVDLPLFAAEFSVTDADGDALVLVVGAGDHYTVTDTTVEPENGFIGALVVPVSFFDGTAASNVEMLTVDIANTPPTAAVMPLEIDEEETTVVTLTLIDPDQGQLLGFTIVDGEHYAPGLAANEFVPDPDYNGDLTVDVELSDGLSTTTVHIPVAVLPVNDAPTIAAFPVPLSTGLATPITLTLADVAADDVDQGDMLTLHVAAGTGYDFNGLVVTPTIPGAGSVFINVYVTDADGASSATIEVELAVENSLPVIVAQLTSPSVFEDGTEYAIVAADLDIDEPDAGQPTNIIVVADQPGYTVGSTANAIKPSQNVNGTLSVTVLVNDGIGNGPEFRDFELIVTPVPDAPVGAAQTGNVGGNGLLQGSNLTSGATDVDGATTFSTVAEADQTTEQMGSVHILTNGTYAYLAPRGFTGTDTFTYKISDGMLESAPATVTITVSAPITWYVDDTPSTPSPAPPSGAADGRQSRPYATLASALTASSASQNIHVQHRSAAYVTAGEVQLDDDQVLLGGGNPTISATRVVVRGGDTLDGVTLTGAAGVTGPTGVTIDDATLQNVSIQVTGTGLSLPLVSGNVLLDNVDVVTTAGSGVRFGDTSYAGRQGNFVLNDVSVVAVGGAGLTGTKVTSLSTTGGTNTLNATRGSVLSLDDCGLGASFASATFTNATLVAATPGLRLNNTSGTLSIATTSLTDATSDAVTVTNSSATIALGALTVTTPRSHGVTLQNNPSATIAFTLSSLTTTAGRGLLVDNSGVVNLASSPTITATGGPAVDIRTSSSSAWSFNNLTATNTGGDGVRYSGLSGAARAGGSFNAQHITVTNAHTGSGAGLRVKDTSGNVTIGRLDVDSAQRGLVIDNANGNFALTSLLGNGGTFANLQDDGVHLNGTADVSLNQLTITSPRGHGVRIADGTTTSTLSISNCTITNPGAGAEVDGDFEHAIALGTGAQISTSATISNSTLTSPRDTAVLLSKTSGSAFIQVAGSTINFGGTGSGIVLGHAPSGSGSLFVNISGTTVQAQSGMPTGAGLNVYSAGTGSSTLGVTVSNSTFVTPVDTADDAIIVAGAANGSVDVDIGGATAAEGNYIGGFFNGIKVTASGVSSTLTGNIRQNRVGYLRGNAERRVQGDGVVVVVDPSAASGTTQGSVRIADNQIATKLGLGVYALARNGAATTSHWLTTFLANNVIAAPAQASDGMWLRTSGSTRLCASVTGNDSASTGAGRYDIVVTEGQSDGVKLQQAPATLSSLNNNDTVQTGGGIDVGDVITCPCVGTCP